MQLDGQLSSGSGGLGKLSLSTWCSIYTAYKCTFWLIGTFSNVLYYRQYGREVMGAEICRAQKGAGVKHLQWQAGFGEEWSIGCGYLQDII